MALVPHRMRPAVVIRRRAVRYGVRGASRFWKGVAVVIYSRRMIKRAFGKHPEDLGTRVIGVGSTITVATFTPMKRKDRRRLGITRSSMRADAWADLEAAQRTP